MQSLRFPLRLVCLAAPIIGAGACGGDDGVGPMNPPPLSPPTRLAFQIQPTNSVAGQAFAPGIQVEVQNAAGGRVSGATDPVTLQLGANPANATLAGTVTVNAVGGVATFDGLSMTTAGAGYTLSATSGTLAAATSNAFNISAAGPARLAFRVEPADIGSSWPALTPPVQVAIQDSFGNDVTSANHVIALGMGTNPGGASLQGTATRPAAGGIAIFDDVRVDRPGTGYTLSATSSGLTGAVSSAFAVRSGVTAGDFHACGLSETGQAWCWGSNLSGRLGDGTMTNRSTPVAVTGGLTFVSIAAGRFHTCALTASGTAYCWGNNVEGQLGDGTRTNRHVPTAVAGGLSFRTLSLGSAFTCGLVTSGQAWCWGSFFNAGDTPAPAAGGLAFESMGAGGGHVCTVTPGDGKPYCWGFNNNGQLGDGTTSNRDAPTPVLGGLTVRMVSGGSFGTCALTVGGQAWCWGINTNGEVGDGSNTERHAPVPVSGGLNFASVVASTHACGITIAGAAYCWGRNELGALGDGSSMNRSAPVAVSGGLRFASISTGIQFTCGTTLAGQAYCWGRNDAGQVGDGSTSDRSTPVAVSGGIVFR